MAATITVSTLSGLYDALAHATGGETVQLAGGDYGKMFLGTSSGFDVIFPSNVTITSADPLHPASFSGLDLRGVSNLTLDGVVCDYTFKPGDQIYNAPFSVSGGQNVTIRNSTFDGDVASGTASSSDGFATGVGLSVTGTTNMHLEGNEISNFYRGLTVSDSKGVSITGNDVHAIRSDGMDFIQVQGVTIEANHLHDFQTSPDSGDHPDMIQFWTAGTTEPSTDITIRGNVMDAGAGTWTQSIFMGNEVVSQGLAGSDMFYRNVTIEDNVIVNGQLHGITLGETAGLTIRQNSVLHTDGNTPDGTDSSVEIPAINIASTSTGVSVTGNVTSAINGWTGQSGWAVSQNAFVQDQNPLAPGYYGDVFISSSLTAHDGVHMFLALPGSMIDRLDAGAAATRDYLPEPGTVAALFQASDDVGGSVQTKIFDAGLSLTDLGSLPKGTVFEWSFGDGTTAQGQKVTHSFTNGGHYDVVLTVRLPGGVSDTVHGTIGVQDRDILTLGTDGLFQAHDYENSILLPTSPFASAAGLQLGGTGVAASIDSAHVADILRAQDFDIALKLDAGSKASYGEVFRLHGSIIASINEKGEVVVQAFNAQVNQIQLTSTGISVTDLKSHDIDIRLHDGSLQLWVDGKIASQAAFAGTLNTFGPTDMTFGNPWGGKNFLGDVTAFDIKVGEHALAQDRSILNLGADGQFHAGGATQALTLPVSDITPAPGLQLGMVGVAAIVAGSQVTDLLQAHDFDIALRLNADSAASAGQIFHLCGSISARVNSTGALWVRAFDTAGNLTRLTTTGVVLNDLAAHDVDIRLHDGTLQIWVDGTVAAQTAFTGTLHSYDTHNLHFGNRLSETNFQGTLSAFDLTVAGDTPTAPVEHAAAFAPHHDGAWGAIL